MSRGADHRDDPKHISDVYRQWDLEDLQRFLPLLRATGEESFTMGRLLYLGMTIGFGGRRVRRLTRIAVELKLLISMRLHRTTHYLLPGI